MGGEKSGPKREEPPKAPNEVGPWEGVVGLGRGGALLSIDCLLSAKGLQIKCTNSHSNEMLRLKIIGVAGGGEGAGWLMPPPPTFSCHTWYSFQR